MRTTNPIEQHLADHAPTIGDHARADYDYDHATQQAQQRAIRGYLKRNAPSPFAGLLHMLDMQRPFKRRTF